MMKMKQDDEDQVGRRKRICNNLKKARSQDKVGWKKIYYLLFLVFRRLSSCAYSFNIYTKEVLFSFWNLSVLSQERGRWLGNIMVCSLSVKLQPR